MSEQEDDQFVTSKKALEILGITSMSTLKRYVDERRIKKYKSGIGREPLYKLSELRDLKEIKPVEDE